MSSTFSVAESFDQQADWCERLGSPLYAHLLSRCAGAYEGPGALRELLQPHENDDAATILPLRFMGAIHRLVLEERAPELAKFYPSVGGIVELTRAWEAFRETVRLHKDAISLLIERPVQTNEVGRSGSLLAGFGLIAKRTGLPLRLLEIGTSAGLNLLWDQYRYEWSGGSWGNPLSPVRLENVFIDGVLSLPATIPVIDRAGCDPSPVDITSASGCLTLHSYIWADQVDRVRRLSAAIKVARAVPCVIEKMHGAEWLEGCLRNPCGGAATVIFQSAVWQYIVESEKQRIITIIEEAGKRASEMSPLAWLRMEGDNKVFEIRLRIYPGFKEQIIGTSGPHAPSVRWLVEAH